MDALGKGSALGWDVASRFEFGSRGAGPVAAVFKDGADGRVCLVVVTHARAGAFLVADVDRRVEELGALVEHPAMGLSTPWAGELYGSLASAIGHARDIFLEGLEAPRPGAVPSLADEIGRRRPVTGP